MNTENKILNLFEQNSEWTVQELSENISVSKQMIHKVLKKLIDQKEIEKFGSAPKTFYRKLFTEKIETLKFDISEEDEKFLKKEFLLISETGKYLEGIDGFANWCKKRNLPIEKTVKEFILTKEKYTKFVDEKGFIDGTEKLKSTKGFDEIYLKNLYYLDFYAIERNKKTKLGTILHYAKQGQNKFLMQILMQEIAKPIQDFIQNSNIQAVGFVPPTIKRETQLMKFIENSVKTNLPILQIKKMSGIIPVPQKSLNKLEERINNADTTFGVFGNTNYETVLLIDDAVGSGATINQIAKKLIDKNVAKNVIGLAIVGSYKGFEVITDV